MPSVTLYSQKKSYLCTKIIFMKYLVPFILLALFVSCGSDSELIKRLEEIRSLSNSDPVRALAAYDSLRLSGPAPQGEYARMKYDLLGIRVKDKNDILPESDSLIRVLVEYFENNGSNQELQEAYYYAGSVYRDLKDTPRALGFFLKSSQCSDSGQIDSLMQRNCFSQLYYIYHNVQDYIHALDAAEKECEIAEKIGVLDDCSLVHVSNTQIRLDKDSAAMNIMSEVLDHQQNFPARQRDANIIFDLLYSFSHLNKIGQADSCYHLLFDMGVSSGENYIQMLSLAEYFRTIGDLKHSVLYYQHIVELGEIEGKYNAYMRLSQIHKELGDSIKAREYAEKFMEASIQLDLGQRQELAATVNNQYQYYRNEIEEQRLINDKQKYQLRLYCAIGGIITLLLSGLLLHYYRKNIRLARLSKLADSITDVHKRSLEKQRELNEEEQLVATIQESIEFGKEELAAAKAELRLSLDETKAKKAELAAVEKDLYAQKDLVQKKIVELACVQDQLKQTEDELTRNTKLLAEKIEQNKALYSLRHQAALKGSARHTLTSIKKLIEGTDHDELMVWDEFTDVMDALYPEFNAQMFERLGKLKPLQTRTCYLLKAGYQGSEIQHILAKDVSRATAWRWIKAYGSALADVMNG